MIRAMNAADFDWAAALMERRRERYAEFSPVFWHPAVGVAASHAEFLRSVGEFRGAVALRTDTGFLVSHPQDGRCFVDDFAVETDDRWADDGRALLLAAWAGSHSAEQEMVRVVSARRDEPKRTMLSALGLEVVERWWVKELDPIGEATTWGAVAVAGVDAVIGPAPPVYDPGGPVCLLGDVDPDQAAAAADAAAELGAVLAIVQLTTDPVESEPALEAAGFHNPSEFYEGVPTQ